MNSVKASNCSLPPLIRFLSSHGRRASPRPGILGVFTPRSRLFSGPSSNTFMEVVKTVLMQASATNERVAIRAEQKSYGYLQLGASALNVSNLLHNKDVKGTNGMRYLDGARVGIVAKPSAEFVSGILGTWLCGGVAVPLALSYPEAELFHVMNDSDISMILSTQEHQQLLENVAAKCSSHLSLIPAITSMEQSGSAADNMVAKLIGEIEDSRIAEGDDPALILYTSGTTGKPKGVVHTYKSIISQWNENCERLNGFTNCVKKDLPCDVTPVFGLLSGPNSDRDVHGLFNALLAPLYAGAVVEFMPKFSVHGVWQRWQESYPKDGSIADDAITLFTGVPTMYTRLLQGYEKMDLDLQVASASAASKLRLMMCGSSALPYPVLKLWEEITGHRLLERYGMTEFFMALSNPLHGIRKGGTVGKALPRVEVKIIPEDGSATGTTEVGELCVRSPSLFKEYWKQPKITKESFIDGGFFKTGDTVTVDEDGYYIILGRTNADIMKVGGYKLSALEIEAVLLEHEVVSECCILGLPDKAYGEVVCAIIVPQPDARRRSEQELKPAISLEELQNWSKEKLAPYKIPTKLFLWDSLPRNAMGKVNKKALKKLLEGQ